mgnify:CR=1 FL=1
MINKKYQKSLRDKVIFLNNKFIYNEISKRITDSLDLINIKFSNILEIGINDQEVFKFLIKKNPKASILRSDISTIKLHKQNHKNKLFLDVDSWNLEKNTYDLIYSNFYIHLTNDFNMLLKNILNSLKPNGFFIATIPSPLNIYQLVRSMMQTDLDLYGGVFQRINPTINVENLLSILQKHQYKIPLINLDKIVFKYNNFNNLLNDLRAMQLTYCYDERSKKFEKKNYFEKLKKNYERNYFKEKKFILDTDFIVISGWKSHSSQQTPLKPGQAKNSLEDFIK